MNLGVDRQRSMKPLLGVAIDEAVKLALMDSAFAVELIKGRDVKVGHYFRDLLWAERGPEWWEFSALMRNNMDEGAIGQDSPWREGWEAGLAVSNGHVCELGASDDQGQWVVLDDLQALRYRVLWGEQYLVTRDLTDKEMGAIDQNVYNWPTRFIDFDPGALARNVSNRLLGTGNWQNGDVYAGNASGQEIVDSCLARPNRNQIDELAFDMGLTPADDDSTDVPKG